MLTRKVSPNSENIFSNSSIKSRFEKFRRRLILQIESSILRNEGKNHDFVKINKSNRRFFDSKGKIVGFVRDSKTETFFFLSRNEKEKFHQIQRKFFQIHRFKSRFEKFRQRLILQIESSILRNEEKNR